MAFTTPVLFVTYQTLSKLLPKDISVFLANAYASLIGVIIMLNLHLLTRSNKSLQLPSKSLALVIGMGIFISLGNFGIIKAYSLGAPQSTFTVYFYVTLIIFGLLFGLLFWHERFNLAQLGGIVLSILGIFIVFYFKK